jgi:hypothetical protein
LKDKKQKAQKLAKQKPLWEALGFEDEIGFLGYQEYNKEESVYIELDEFESVLREDKLSPYRNLNQQRYNEQPNI